MSSINSVLLLGNVGSVEVKEFGEGKFLVQVSVATTSGYKKKDGEYENVTEWHKCIFAIPSLAERAKNIAVGDSIEVRGSIKTNKWVDSKTDEEKSNKEISATYYTTHKKGAKSGGSEPSGQPEAANKAATAPDDLPF